jgi:hypothetical protein
LKSSFHFCFVSSDVGFGFVADGVNVLLGLNPEACGVGFWAAGEFLVDAAGAWD